LRAYAAQAPTRTSAIRRSACAPPPPQWGNALVTPHISAAWQHAFEDVTTAAGLAFASTGIGFTVYGVPLAEDTALVEAGLDLNLNPTATLGVSYSGQFASDVEDNAVKGRFTWLF
jgi:outer membrane autotransporter protein